MKFIFSFALVVLYVAFTGARHNVEINHLAEDGNIENGVGKEQDSGHGTGTGNSHSHPEPASMEPANTKEEKEGENAQNSVEAIGAPPTPQPEIEKRRDKRIPSGFPTRLPPTPIPAPGPETTRQPPGTIRLTGDPPEDLPECPKRIDAIDDMDKATWQHYFGFDDELVLAFVGDYVWRLGKLGVVAGWPKHIREMFINYEYPNVEAALFKSDHLYLFKDKHIFIYKVKKVDNFTISVEPIGQYGYDSIGIGDRLDAVFAANWRAQPHIHSWTAEAVYLFRGHEYYRMSYGDYIDAGYPQSISKWGLSASLVQRGLDAAFQWEDNGEFYFFIGAEYFKHDSVNRRPADDYPSYPRPIDVWWFNKGSENSFCV